jgi:hypothetical protein
MSLKKNRVASARPLLADLAISLHNRLEKAVSGD